MDPMYTWLLQKCITEQAPIITKIIINDSLLSGIFPELLKVAHITPFIKNPKFDGKIVKNYCSEANLKFLSKSIEGAAVSQI
ncbi:hypothetical protein HOLleu_15063 [Holothuria leucospilota]|uniref:Uncharacterized protein n=1 Tax=Holothuria leucospilota TaxID=206669 RepID=A0A9Q1HC71_HOLLE|nr:hypothetical protein HOLleu_15063 [Holothuria leucospilota]